MTQFERSMLLFIDSTVHFCFEMRNSDLNAMKNRWRIFDNERTSLQCFGKWSVNRSQFAMLLKVVEQLQRLLSVLLQQNMSPIVHLFEFDVLINML